MIVIDGEPWPPRLHGTGTEDYFGTAFAPFRAPSPCTLPWPHRLLGRRKSGPSRGKNSMYRFHIEDPVRFRKSIRVSIEHGEAERAFKRLLVHRVLVPARAAQAVSGDVACGNAETASPLEAPARRASVVTAPPDQAEPGCRASRHAHRSLPGETPGNPPSPSCPGARPRTARARSAPSRSPGPHPRPTVERSTVRRSPSPDSWRR